MILLFIGTIGSYAANPLSSTEQNNAKNARLQVHEVTGVVTDNNGDPLPGANIIV